MVTTAGRRYSRATLMALILMLTSAAPGARDLPDVPGAGPGDVWLMVDTTALTLSLMQGNETLLSYENIAIGSQGATWNKRNGDEKTPLGDFRINEIRPSERFTLFLSLDYPNMNHAERALEEGRIDSGEYQRIEKARSAGAPPQDTQLGGHLGIHGLGLGDPEIHEQVNWTNGCIALTNEQVEDLAARINRGTVVRIR